MFISKSSKESTPILHRLVVEKHGSHNQSSHGRGGGSGSGGGGGGGSSTAPKSEAISNAEKALDNNIVGAEKVLANAKNATTANGARGAVKGFKDVKGALGDKKKMDRVKLKRNSLAERIRSSPTAAFDASYSEDVGYINAATMGLAQYGNL